RRAGDVDGIVQTDRSGECQGYCQRRIPTGPEHDTGHWLVDIDPIGSAQYGLAALERGPRKAGARLKVLIVLVIDLIDVRANAYERSGLGIEDDESIVTLAGCHVPLVTQAQFKRQIRSHLVIVLDEKSDCSLSN